MKQERTTVAEDEIDLVELVKTIWSGREIIIKVTSIFILFGLIFALTSKVEYEASCKLLPESQEGMKGRLGGLSGLAGLAGIDLGLGGTGVLTPELYPEIAKSLPFQLKILQDTLYFENVDIRTTAFHYFKEIDSPSLLGYVSAYTIGLPWVIKSLFTKDQEEIDLPVPGDKSQIRISKEDWKLIERFKKRININIDNKSNLIDVAVEMPDPVAAAEVTDRVVSLLTQEVTNYKIDKAKVSLDFVQSSFKDAKKKFEEAQVAVAEMTDRNRNVNSALAEIELQRLQNEYSVAFEVYKGLASQVEQAKIKLKEETPVFTILEPVRVPEDKSKPRRGLMLVAFTFLGMCFSVILILLKNNFRK